MSSSPSSPSVPVLLLAIPAAVFFAVVLGAICIALAQGETSPCAGTPTRTVEGIPSTLVPIYEQASAKYGLGTRGPSILAAINGIETGFGSNVGTSSAGAQGWMQFMPATWNTYGVDADGDGDRDTDDPWDAIFAAANYLRASGAPKDWPEAIFAYNHAQWYVEDVLADASKYSGEGVVASQATCVPATSGIAQLQESQTLRAPRAFQPLPKKLWNGAGPPQSVDARIWPDAVWLLETYGLVVTAAREPGHQTHGDGTAIDVVPAPGRGWDAARKAAIDLGWRESCGSSGTAPACPLVPAIQFIGYNGFPSHGDPAHAGSNAHLHVSWKSSAYGCPGLCGPRDWVIVFPIE